VRRFFSIQLGVTTALLLASSASGQPPASSQAHVSAQGLACSVAPPLRNTAPAAVRLSPAPTLPDDSREREARALLEYWSPNFAQQVSADHPERDRPLPIDFDGDWDATNNWSDLTPELRRAQPVVYGAATLTSTDAYLFFTLFYPRDWSSPLCVSYVCHDNDLEVVLLVVHRASKSGHGELVLVETKAHLDYVALRGSELATDAGGRPWIRVESEGHGMYPVHAGEPLAATAQRLLPRSSLQASEGSGASSARYELESLHDTLWAHRDPDATQRALWTSGESGFLAYAGARLGRRGHSLGVSMAGHEYKGGVRPPWGLKGLAGERGDWFFDPAYVALLRHRDWFAPELPSLDYVFNPFLADLTSECVDRGCPATLPPPFPTRLGVVTGLVLASGLVSLRARRRVLAKCRRAWRRWRSR
jgi:hypothetical protein